MKFDDRIYELGEVMSWDDPEWLVEGLVHRGSSVFLSGPPKSGKSLFVLRVAAAVSSGTAVFGHTCQRGRVVYLAAERARLMKPRVMALMERGVPIDPHNFAVYPRPVPFLIEDEVRDFAEHTGPTDLLVVDTLRRCFGQGKENDNNDMTCWAAGVELFCELTGAAALVVHHNHREQKDRNGRPLPTDYAGGGGLLGALDGQLSLKPAKDRTVTISVEGANEGNFFHAITTTVPHWIDGHQTWVMVESDQPTDMTKKPSLEELVREVLIANPRVTHRELHVKCQQHPTIMKHWPTLSESSVGRILKRWVDRNLVQREQSPYHKQQYFHTWIGDGQTADA